MPHRSHFYPLTLALLASLSATNAIAQAKPTGWEVGVVLDTAATSRGLALGTRDQGLGLGHSDLLVRGALSPQLSAEAIVGFHTQDGKLENHLENAWLQTRALPAGLQVRAGRFASQVGYLNELHPHTDDFTERPLLHRAFLGGHWYDDGARLNWTAPTSFYLRFGAEVFSGQKWVKETAEGSGSGVTALNVKTGADINANQSWQWGLSHLNNRREALVEEHGHTGSEHAHAAAFTGKRMWMSDLVWKWAPDGNNRNQQLRMVWEYAQVSQLNRFADNDKRHSASSLGAVWRFNQAWEVGLRNDWLRVNKPELHNDNGTWVHEFPAGKLRENVWMVAYKPTHMQTLRVQLTQQNAHGMNESGEAIFANPAKRSVQLHYVVGFGAHGAHAY